MKNLILVSCLLSIFFFRVHSKDSCSSDLVLPALHTFNLTGLHCVSVWEAENFILRYKESSTDLWTFVLSTPQLNSWVGMGFSETGKMVGSSAIVGWPTSRGGDIKQYRLTGYRPDKVLPDQGALDVASKTIVSLLSRRYLAFQLKVVTRPLTKTIFARGPDGGLPSVNGILEPHVGATGTTLNYDTTGGSSSSPTAAPASAPASGNQGTRNVAASASRYFAALCLLVAAILW